MSEQPTAAVTPVEPWERKALVELANGALKEQRTARRWGLAFKFLFLVYLVAIAILYTPSVWPDKPTSDAHTALVNLNGVIAPGGEVDADGIVAGLRAAFKDEGTQGVVLRINSPGGSPVQSAYINDEITRLRKKYPDVPLYAVIQDVAASGGYYVAVAADAIYANESSLVGSVGVLMNGFGFPALMDKLGIERRLHTAGERKGFLDPFTTERAADVEHIKVMLDELHQQFIAVVKRGRGDKLQADNEALFSGLVWSGKRGLELGLIDGFGSASFVAREVVGEATIVDFTPRKGLLERLTERLGVSMARELGTSLGLGSLSLR